MLTPVLQRLKSLKVLIAVPTTGLWDAQFGMSLCGLVTAFNSHRVENYKSQEIEILSSKGSILPNLRWDAVRAAKTMKADYLLFLDSDQTFPKTTLHQLVGHQKDIVAANIATKRIPAQPTARAFSAAMTQGIPIYTDLESQGLERVWRIGCGVMLIAKRVFEKLGPGAFAMPYNEEWDKYQGEDWSLCETASRLGFEIYIDHDLSKHVGHVGAYRFTHEVVGEVKRVEVA